MGIFRRRDRTADDPPGAGGESGREAERDREIETLKAAVVELRRQLAMRADAESRDLRAEIASLRAEFGGRLQAIDDRWSTPLTDPPPPPPAPAADPAAGIAEIDGKLAALDARLTAVSTELANQLSELGTDLDALTRVEADRVTATEVQELTGALGARIDELTDEMDETRAARIVLANEQVRAQIALRRDLARTIDELRRTQR